MAQGQSDTGEDRLVSVRTLQKELDFDTLNITEEEVNDKLIVFEMLRYLSD